MAMPLYSSVGAVLGGRERRGADGDNLAFYLGTNITKESVF